MASPAIQFALRSHFEPPTTWTTAPTIAPTIAPAKLQELSSTIGEKTLASQRASEFVRPWRNRRSRNWSTHAENRHDPGGAIMYICLGGDPSVCYEYARHEKGKNGHRGQTLWPQCRRPHEQLACLSLAAARRRLATVASASLWSDVQQSRLTSQSGATTASRPPTTRTTASTSAPTISSCCDVGDLVSATAGCYHAAQ